jgi:hypothetical protein
MMTTVLRTSEQVVDFEYALNPFQYICTNASSSAFSPHRDLDTPYIFQNRGYTTADQRYGGQFQLNGNTSAESYINTTITSRSTNASPIGKIPSSQAPHTISRYSLLSVAFPPTRSVNSTFAVCDNYTMSSMSYNAVGQTFTPIRSNDAMQQIDLAKAVPLSVPYLSFHDLTV